MGRGSTRVVMGGGDMNGLQKHIYILLCKKLSKGLLSHTKKGQLLKRKKNKSGMFYDHLSSLLVDSLRS